MDTELINTINILGLINPSRKSKKRPPIAIITTALTTTTGITVQDVAAITAQGKNIIRIPRKEKNSGGQVVIPVN